MAIQLFAGQPVTTEQVRSTLKLLRYYRAFLRSNCTGMKDPEGAPFGVCGSPTRDKRYIQNKLTRYLHCAINRKAQYYHGPPDVLDCPLNHRGLPCRKWASLYQADLERDRRLIYRHHSMRIRFRLTSLCLPEMRRRFWHLAADPSEE